MALYNSLQGNLGLGKAIEYFTSHSIPVAIPLNDTQKYDLIADFNGKLQRISVKTSRCTDNNISFSVQLRNTGGSSGDNKIRPFDKNSCHIFRIPRKSGKIKHSAKKSFSQKAVIL